MGIQGVGGERPELYFLPSKSNESQGRLQIGKDLDHLNVAARLAPESRSWLGKKIDDMKFIEIKLNTTNYGRVENKAYRVNVNSLAKLLGVTPKEVRRLGKEGRLVQVIEDYSAIRSKYDGELNKGFLASNKEQFRPLTPAVLMKTIAQSALVLKPEDKEGKEITVEGIQFKVSQRPKDDSKARSVGIMLLATTRNPNLRPINVSDPQPPAPPPRKRERIEH